MKSNTFHFTLWVLLFSLLSLDFLWAQSLEREAFLDAETRFIEGNYALALERYEEFIRSWPDSNYAADARYRRAVSLYRLGQVDEAYTAFLSVEGRFRSTKYLTYVPFWKGVIEYDRGDHEAAISRFKALTIDPPDTDTLRQALLYLGKSATALGDGDTAMASFERLLDELSVLPHHREDEPSALLILADLYTRKELYDKQVTLWENLDPLRLDAPTREQLSLRAAEAYLALGSESMAVSLFQTLSDSPRRGIAGTSLQRLLEYERRRGDETGVQSVIVKAENLLRSDPEALSEFWLGVGSDAFHEGNLDLARSYFLRISAIQGADRVSQEVPIYLAEIAYRQSNLSEAYRILSESEKVVVGDRALLTVRLGWYALQKKDWSSSVLHFTDALKLSESEGKNDLAEYARTHLAYGLYRSGRLEESLASLGSVPSSGLEPGPRLRAELLRLTGRAEASMESLDALITTDPSWMEAQVMRMALLFEKNQYARVLEASAVLDKANTGKLSQEYQYAIAYMTGISAAATGDYDGAGEVLVLSEGLAFPDLVTVPWVVYYKGWAFYRAAKFKEAASIFTDFLKKYPNHGQAYNAAYLGAWSHARSSDYRNGALMAVTAAEKAAAGIVPRGDNSVEAEARAKYLEGTFRPFFSDWSGAIKALQQAMALPSLYKVRAAFEIGTVHYLAGKIDEADLAFAQVSRDYPDDPLASEAAYRRGELMYGAQRWTQAVDRFSAYRQTYPSGSHVDGALYFGALSQKALGHVDAAILLWERLLREFTKGRYRFPTMLALGEAYWSKADWEAAFRIYTSALAEFGDEARAAKVDEEAETLRYLMAKLPEKAARLHVRLNRENGVATPLGRAAALELAYFYITETAQREAGAALADEVLALRKEDPASAAEAYFLKGEYYTIMETWAQAASSYLEAVSLAAELPVSAKSVKGISIRNDLTPEALFKAVRAFIRLGKTENAQETVSTLGRLYPSSTWTSQARRLLEASR